VHVYIYANTQKCDCGGRPGRHSVWGNIDRCLVLLSIHVKGWGKKKKYGKCMLHASIPTYLFPSDVSVCVRVYLSVVCTCMSVYEREREREREREVVVLSRSSLGHKCMSVYERERSWSRSVCFFPRKTFFEKSFSFFFFFLCKLVLVFIFINYFSSLSFSFSTHSTWPPSRSRAVVRHCQSCRKRLHYCRYRHKLITVRAKCHRIFFLVEIFLKNNNFEYKIFYVKTN